MLNLDETLSINLNYIFQKDLYLKSLVYSIGVTIFIDIVRSQVAEVNLLQLVPGFYLILLFFSFILLLSLSFFIFQIPLESDNRKELGTKTVNKVEFFILIKLSLFFLYTAFIIVLTTVIPLSLDSFNSYGEKTLENIWSFDEVINLEFILLTILIFLSQFPLLFTNGLSTEKDINFLPEFWKYLSLIIFLMSGFLTPTIDGYTQLSFAISAMSLYLITINLIGKRVNVKFNVTSSISS